MRPRLKMSVPPPVWKSNVGRPTPSPRESHYVISAPAAAIDVARVQVQRRVGDEESGAHHINVGVAPHRDGDERGAEVPEPPRAGIRMNHARVAARLAHERHAFP